MARATRSTTVQQHSPGVDQNIPDSLLIPPSKQSKKRKRQSNGADEDDDSSMPMAKQPRPEPEYKDVGDLPLDAFDAAKILSVLEMIDTQGLLDRVVHLPLEQSSSTQQFVARSLRSLLEIPCTQSIRQLRAAIYPLFPISSHPRTKPSAPAAQQHHFCTLALSLLDQAASQRHSGISLERDSVFLSETDSISDLNTSKKAYALVQRLPNGEWWSSSSGMRDGEAGLTAAEVKSMATGQAELVTILPSLPIPSEDLPKLGELRPNHIPAYRPKSLDRSAALLLKSRKLSSGRYLDYGHYSSFAPSFESDGVEIGSEGLGEIVYDRGLRKKARLLKEKLTRTAQNKARTKSIQDIMDVDSPMQGSQDRWEEVLPDLFPPDQIAALKAGMADLELEAGITELLQHNSTALKELVGLQRARLWANKKVESGGEEETLAQSIMTSLTLLSSLRPRTSTSTTSTLIPAPDILRTLHRSLPAAPASGWQGTLLTSAPTALRDDSTIRVKPGAIRAAASGTTTTTNKASPTTNGTTTAPAPQYVVPGTYRPPTTQVPASNVALGYSGGTSYYKEYPKVPPLPGQYPPPYGYPYYQMPRQDPGYYGTYPAAGYPFPVPQQGRAVPNLAKPPAQNGWAVGYNGLPVAAMSPNLKRPGPGTAAGGTYPNQPYGR